VTDFMRDRRGDELLGVRRVATDGVQQKRAHGAGGIRIDRLGQQIAGRREADGIGVRHDLLNCVEVVDAAAVRRCDGPALRPIAGRFAGVLGKTAVTTRSGCRLTASPTAAV